VKLIADKKALVIGGSRGIGAAVVRRLCMDGASTVFSYFASESEAQALAVETGAVAVSCDSSDRDATTALVREQEPLDILVVSAGIALIGSAVELDPDAVDRMIDINVRSPYHAAVEASRQMRDGGRIVIIGSVNGDRIPLAGGAAYAMSKSAMQGMVRGLARELGARGITVNNVQPGPTDTEMNPAQGPMKDLMHSFMAIKRHVRPQEVAAMVAYLVGPEAGMISGAQHTIDGGFGA
jgi:cyclic-di-GMP-binding biofilm dispersal mediator protein